MASDLYSAKATKTDTECCDRASNGVRMHRAFLTRSIDRVRVTGTPSTGSVAPTSFIITVDRVNSPIWSHFPVDAKMMAIYSRGF